MDVMNRFDVLEDNDNCLYQLTELHNNIIKKNAEAKAEKRRNWGDMPQDILILIFMKLGAIGILFRAQSVCSAWRKLSKDPHVFRCINLRENQWDFLFQSLGRNLLHYSERKFCIQVQKIVQEAVHRSCGQLDELVIDQFCPDAILHYILDRSHSIKYLRVFYRNLSVEQEVQLIRKVPFLEELELYSQYHEKYFIIEVGKLCPHIKCLRYTCSCSYKRLDEIAAAIADEIPQLRRLHLSATKLTDIGLQALLDGCRDLEYLDIGQCVDANIGEELRKECQARIKSLVLPVFQNRIGGSDEDSRKHGSYSWSYWSDFDESYDSEDLYDVDDVDETLLFPRKLVSYYH